MSRALHRAAVAITTDGAVLANVTEILGVSDLEKALERLCETEGPIFIGVPVSRADARVLLARVEDAAAEALAKLVGRQRRRRVTARKRRSTAS